MRAAAHNCTLSLKLAESAGHDRRHQPPPAAAGRRDERLWTCVRRATLLTALENVPQALLTTTDWEDFTLNSAPRPALHCCQRQPFIR
ncbi:MAG: hypothetical protein R3A44_12760 [Caldilineaceae bacterium]